MSKRAQESTAKEGSAVAKTETDEFGVKEPLERKEKPSARLECFEQPGESSFEPALCFTERQETGAKQQPRPNSIFPRATTR